MSKIKKALPKATEPKAPAKKASTSQLDMLKLIAGDIKGDFTFEEKEEVKYTRARMLSYNRASVFGGFPAGAVYEIHGPNGGGKTALLMEILASAQEAGHLTSFHDHERAANDKRWISALGLDLKSCVYRNKKKDGEGIFTFEDSAQEINEMIKNFTAAKRKGQIPEHVLLYIGVDSVAKMVPADKLKKDAKVGDANYGLTARLMSDWLQTLIALVGGSDVAVIFLNQERVNVGAKPWEPKFKSFGGEALQYDAHVRIRVFQTGNVMEKVPGNDEEIVVGRKHKFLLEKNKYGYPMQSGMFYTSNGLGEAPLGFDDVRCTVEEALFQGVIEKGGSWYTSPYFNGSLQGERKLREFLRENDNVHQMIKDAVYEMILDGRAKLSEGDDEDDGLESGETET